MASRRLQAKPEEALAPNRPAKMPAARLIRASTSISPLQVHLAHVPGLNALVDDGGRHKGDERSSSLGGMSRQRAATCLSKAACRRGAALRALGVGTSRFFRSSAGSWAIST